MEKISMTLIHQITFVVLLLYDIIHAKQNEFFFVLSLIFNIYALRIQSCVSIIRCDARKLKSNNKYLWKMFNQNCDVIAEQIMTNIFFTSVAHSRTHLNRVAA